MPSNIFDSTLFKLNTTTGRPNRRLRLESDMTKLEIAKYPKRFVIKNKSGHVNEFLLEKISRGLMADGFKDFARYTPGPHSGLRFILDYVYIFKEKD